jgi:probable rRNA maturation factor
LEVQLDNRQDRPLDLDRWHQDLTRMMMAAGLPERAELSVTFGDDRLLHDLNREHRGIDRPTDVLSFPLLEPDDEPPPEPLPYALGDVIVSIETAERQARAYGHSTEREIGFLLAHGLLHLLGYDHETADEEREMRMRQRELLEAIGLGLEGPEA